MNPRVSNHARLCWISYAWFCRTSRRDIFTDRRIYYYFSAIPCWASTLSCSSQSYRCDLIWISKCEPLSRSSYVYSWDWSTVDCSLWCYFRDESSRAWRDRDSQWEIICSHRENPYNPPHCNLRIFMPKNQILENITIEKLIFWWKWLGVAPDGRKVIITGGCIPQSIVNVRVLKERKSHYEGQELEVVKKSPLEVPLQEWHQLYGWAKWLTIGYEDQLKIKEWQIKEAFHHLRDYTTETIWHPIIASPQIYGYRNKVEFSWGKYISEREWVHDDFRFGFHAQGQFDRIIDCAYCALADEEINDIFHTVDTLSRSSWFPTYDPKTAEGFWRHLVVRKAREKWGIMLIFSVNSVYEWKEKIDFFTKMVQQLIEKFSNIASIFFLENTGRADIVQWNPILLFGKPSIAETLLGLTFEIQPKSFFQVNTLGAEKLYTQAIDFIRNKWGVLLDLYAGTGTIGILLAKYFERVYSVEMVESASADGEKNSDRNGITNVEFICKKTEVFAQEFKEAWKKADTIVIDPPRDGMHPSTLPSLLAFGAREIIYVSCNPATLTRDLEVLVGKTRDEKMENILKYRITDVVPVDMFPHTHHIETIVRLEKV